MKQCKCRKTRIWIVEASLRVTKPDEGIQLRTLEVAKSLLKDRVLKVLAWKAWALLLLSLHSYKHASGASVSKMLLSCASNLEKCMLSELGGGIWR